MRQSFFVVASRTFDFCPPAEFLDPGTVFGPWTEAQEELLGTFFGPFKESQEELPFLGAALLEDGRDREPSSKGGSGSVKAARGRLAMESYHMSISYSGRKASACPNVFLRIIALYFLGGRFL